MEGGRVHLQDLKALQSLQREGVDGLDEHLQHHRIDGALAAPISSGQSVG
jgi:hypothetical protein